MTEGFQTIEADDIASDDGKLIERVMQLVGTGPVTGFTQLNGI